jgi:hypothetical protein
MLPEGTPATLAEQMLPTLSRVPLRHLILSQPMVFGVGLRYGSSHHLFRRRAWWASGPAHFPSQLMESGMCAKKRPNCACQFPELTIQCY